jgi:hypothetical protein
MEFEKRSFHNSESSVERDDENSDGITNMDITVIEDSDNIVNYNGIDDEMNQDFNVASTLTLKKNLHATFEKHAGDEKMTNRVKAKIQAFEQVNKDQKFGKAIHGPNMNNNKVRFDVPPAKPPIVPVTRNTASENDSLLSVYLRVRPLTASKDVLEQDQEAILNTVEIINADDEGSKSTRIRTYPPLQSNASKTSRGPSNSYCSKPVEADPQALESAVKGVKEFEFSQVFGPECSQRDLYEIIASPLVNGLFPKDDVTRVGDKIVGQSALLFSYGITNAGKTFTIMGKERNGRVGCNDEARVREYDGIVPRTIENILTKIDELNKRVVNSRVRYSLHMSYLEIYNEDIYDLLPKDNPSGGSKFGKHILDRDRKLQIRDLRNGNIHVKGLAKHRVSNLGQGLELAQTAMNKRHTSSNNINSDSSRSHFICQFELCATPVLQEKGDDNNSIVTETSEYITDDDSVVSVGSKPKTARFWVVDLAGSERSKRTGTFSRSARQKEASLINSSLMNLMTCLRALKKNQSSNNSRMMVPFRDSKLTHLFMGHLTGLSASRTSMIVNVNPSVADFDETQHVLSYAVHARSVRIDSSEYTKKKHQIQGTNANIIHGPGHNSSSLQNRTKSPPRKIAKLAKKLSPRTALARRREMIAKKKNPDLKRTNDSDKNISKDVSDKPKTKMIGSKRKLEDEVRNLREALDSFRLKATRFQRENLRLQSQLETREAEIREELAEQYAEQIRFTNEKHEEIVLRLKQQLRSSTQTPSISAKKARMDRADQIIEELMDKVEEGEEEMERMRVEYQQQIEEIIKEKNSEIKCLCTKHALELKKRDEEISRLQLELEEGPSLTDGSNYYSDASIEYEAKENVADDSVDATSTPGLKRLPRGRCSEVACANVSPPTNHTGSTKKTLGKRLRSKASPFKVLSGNKKHSRSSSAIDDVVFPSSQPEVDESGLYKKPRGRAPQGRKWDAEVGGWKLSILS